jgi:hypothetical protein
MKQRQLGPSGPLVGAIGLGGMPLSIKADRPSEADAVRLLTRAAELGMTLVGHSRCLLPQRQRNRAQRATLCHRLPRIAL